MIDHPFAWPLRYNLSCVSGMFIAISGSGLGMIYTQIVEWNLQLKEKCTFKL
jgi:hypothetical protein